jgi:TolB-like protein/DNA-binding winged helix-turn-helix (wHTH) protein/tetratricopeptide (TPR) repeat protein
MRAKAHEGGCDSVASERFLTSGTIRLDLCDERLWVGDEAPRIGGKAFALLHMLMRNAQTLVMKEALFDEVWNGLAVSDSVLTTAVKELRQALHDDARKPQLIETVHRRGYRFMRPVAVTDEAIAPTANSNLSLRPLKSRRRWLAGGLLALIAAGLIWLFVPSASREIPTASAATLAHSKSVAVLPFRDLSAGGDQSWFADGVTEEIQSRLIRTPDLHVVSKLTVANFRNQSGSLSDKARNLGVAHILDGSVRRVGGRVRVTVELVRASDGSQLWSQTYDRAANDVISIQEDIAFRIASALKTVMEPAKLRAMVAAGTRSVEAYEAFLQGVAADDLGNVTGGRKPALAAAQAYERARTLDPGFAEAHWRAAQKWFGKETRINGSVSGAGYTENEQKVQYVLRIDQAIANSADAAQQLKYRAAKAVVRMELRKAHALMVDYLKVRPRDIDAWEDMGEFAAYANESEWLKRSGERIHRLSLEAREPRSRAITVAVMAMQLDEAVARAREQIRLRPANVMMKYQGHRAMIWAGRTDEARQLLNPILASDLPPMNRMLSELRQACGEGDLAKALEIRVRMDAEKPDLNEQWQVAQILGDYATATEALQPLDHEGRLQTLLQFMINPTFDSSAYPNLRSAMARDGVVRWKVWPMPGACKRSQAFAQKRPGGPLTAGPSDTEPKRQPSQSRHGVNP